MGFPAPAWASYLKRSQGTASMGYCFNGHFQAGKNQKKTRKKQKHFSTHLSISRLLSSSALLKQYSVSCNVLSHPPSHPHMNASTHTYIHAMHASIHYHTQHSSMHPYPWTHEPMHCSVMHPPIHPSINLSIRPCINQSIHPSTYPCVLFVYPLIHICTHASINPFIVCWVFLLAMAYVHPYLLTYIHAATTI